MASGIWTVTSRHFADLRRAEPAPKRRGQTVKLRSKLGGYGNDKCYLPDAPEEDEIRGGWGEKQVPAAVARLVFDEQRENLKISFTTSTTSISSSHSVGTTSTSASSSCSRSSCSVTTIDSATMSRSST